jgi:hypothetical protein
VAGNNPQQQQQQQPQANGSANPLLLQPHQLLAQQQQQLAGKYSSVRHLVRISLPKGGNEDEKRSDFREKPTAGSVYFESTADAPS